MTLPPLTRPAPSGRIKRSGKRRGNARLIDRLIADPGDDNGVHEESLRVLERHWPEISGKALRLIFASFDGTHVVTESMTDEESVAMFQVLRALMDTLETDSSRRAWRDLAIAEEYVYFHEFAGHDIVMPGVCARWGLSETLVKQALKRCRKEAREQLQRQKEHHGNWTPELREAYLAEGIEPNFDDYMRRVLNQTRDGFLSGEQCMPRAKASAKSGRK